MTDRVDLNSMTDAEKADYYERCRQEMNRRSPSGPPADDDSAAPAGQ